VPEPINVDAGFMLLERAAAQRTLIIDWAAVQALTTFLVRMRYRCILVTADTRPMPRAAH
jgi:hypothetical protein